MSDIDVLKELIRNEHLGVPPQGSYGKPYLRLTEPKAGYEITIRNVPEHSLAVKADGFKGGEWFFTGKNGECKRADYIVFSEHLNGIQAICVELTKAQKSWTEIEQQLIGSKCLLDYISSIGENFIKNPFSAKPESVAFVKIGNIDDKPIKKRNTQNNGYIRESKRLGDVLVLHDPRRIDFKTLIKRGR